MPFRSSFDCLWCGTHHDVRSDADLEGWASLCPECIGRADDNGFLRSRLRAALTERSSVAAPAAAGSATSDAPLAAPAPPTTVPVEPRVLPAAAFDDWYLRRGRFSRGPIVDQPWQMELDEATRWVDAIPMSGVIVELGAGSGWWSTLLAEKGELWAFEPDEAALEQARQRLVAHGLLAHLHVRDPLAPPDRAADVVFAAYLLGSAANEQGLLKRLAVARGWLRVGGTFAFIEASPDEAADAVDGPSGPIWPRDPQVLHEALVAAGFERPELSLTHSAFVLGSAVAAPIESAHD